MRAITLLCTITAIAAGISLVAIAAIVLAQIFVRLGGSSLPSTDDFAAWAMGAAVFLALPHSFLHGKHIRVTLALDRLPEARKRVILRLANGVTLLVLAAASWFASVYVYESYIYNDTSQGIIAVPLWIPQLSMVAGLTACLPILAILTWRGTDSLVLEAESQQYT